MWFMFGRERLMKTKLRFLIFLCILLISACLCFPTSTPDEPYTIIYPTLTRTIEKKTPTFQTISTDSYTRGKLPGLSPDEIKINMEKRGFECDLEYEAIPSDPYYKWNCRKETSLELMLVDYWSTSITTVDLVRASINQFGIPDDNISINFLALMATLPYDGSNPEQARDWVASNLPTIKSAGDVIEMEIGDVKFQLYGIPSARSLKIGDDLPIP